MRSIPALGVGLSLALATPSSGLAPGLPSGQDASEPVASSVANAAAVMDGWSERIRLRAADGWFSIPAHATLMPDGRVQLIGYERILEDPSVPSEVRKATFAITPTPLGDPVPLDHVVTDVPAALDANALVLPPYFVDDELFCTGNTLTADGELFTVGGTRHVLDFVANESFTLGLPYATLWDGASWTRLPNEMVGIGVSGLNARWYATPTRLADGRILVTSGYDVVTPTPTLNLTAEIYDPASGAFGLVSELGAVPLEVFNGDYTHAFVLPKRVDDFGLVLFGQEGVPVLASVEGALPWAVVNLSRPGKLQGELPNLGATSALLPIRSKDGEWGYSNGSVLIAGGSHGTTHMRHVDVFDPTRLRWSERIDTGVMRHHPSSVLLPDGRVLLVGGHNLAGTPELRQATYVDPARRFETQLGTALSGEVRGYHNVALLLPDGRVLVGGGRDLDTQNGPAEKADMRYYLPSYLFEPGRPRILAAPTSLTSGKTFLLTTTKKVSEVILLSLGSMTHSIDMNQRYVQLAKLQSLLLPSGARMTVVAGPPDAQAAPPGYYMLFALDKRRVPSEAAIVRVD
jgi:hypothetical protein